MLFFVQTSKGGVYKKLWNKIDAAMPDSLCHEAQECIERFVTDPHVAKIGQFSKLLFLLFHTKQVN